MATLKYNEANLRAARAQLAKLEAQPRPEEVPPSEAKVEVAQGNVELQRDLADRARAQAAANDPADYLTYWGPTSNAFAILSANGAPLTLAPQYGAALGSTFINLPLNFTGTASQRIAALSANSGKIVTALADDSGGTGRSLLSDPTVTSLIFSVRHRVNPNIELFADGLYFLNQGTIRGGAAGFIFVPAGSPNNPFLGAIDYGFPEPGVTQVETHFREAGETQRVEHQLLDFEVRF